MARSSEQIVNDVKEKIAEKKKKQIHNSGLECYFRCGEQYRLKYIKEIKTPHPLPIIVGIAVDESVTANMQSKMDFLELLPLDEVLDIARDSVKKAFEVEVYLKSGEEREKGRDLMRAATIDKAVRMAKKHYKDFAPNINPIKVQWQWVLKLKDYPYRVVGAVDILEEDVELSEKTGVDDLTIIVDTKTSGKSPGKLIAHKSTQLSTYAMAEESRNGVIPRVRLDYLIDLKGGVKADQYWSTRNHDDFVRIRNRLWIFADSMRAGVFNPVDCGHWICSEDYCGYWESICKYAWRSKNGQ
jgi:hypothetical protein